MLASQILHSSSNRKKILAAKISKKINSVSPVTLVKVTDHESWLLRGATLLQRRFFWGGCLFINTVIIVCLRGRDAWCRGGATLSLSVLFSRSCAVLEHRVLRRGGFRPVVFQVHPGCVLVGRGHHDDSRIRWHEVTNCCCEQPGTPVTIYTTIPYRYHTTTALTTVYTTLPHTDRPTDRPTYDAEPRPVKRSTRSVTRTRTNTQKTHSRKQNNTHHHTESKTMNCCRVWTKTRSTRKDGVS